MLSRVRLFATPWTAACQASLSITNSQSLLRLISIESVMPSNHLILCHPLLLLPSVFPSIRVFSNESALHIRWPKYCSFSFSISPSYEYPGLISFRMEAQSLELNKVISSPGSQPGRPQAAHPVKGGGRFGMRSLTTRTSLCAALSTEQDGDRGTAVGGPGPAGSLRMTLVWPSVPERPPLST